MSDDYRTAEERQEDWEGRLQPVQAITDDMLDGLAATVKAQAVEMPPPETLNTQPPVPHPAVSMEPVTTQIAVPPTIAPPIKRPTRPIRPTRSTRQRRTRTHPSWQRWVRRLGAAVAIWMGLSLLMPPLDLLILGVDARQGEGYVTRTDSIMLLGVQPRRLRVNLLSIPRDLFITVPGYGAQRINTVNVLGELDERGSGPHLLSDAIHTSFGVRPDRYMRLNFTAFEALVNAVGGLHINVPKRIVDYQYPTENYGTMTIQFDPGWQHMDGETALIYARTRHADDDYGRAERQQQVLSALSHKLANPLNWGPAFVAVNRNVDTNMNPIEMTLYAPTTLIGVTHINRLVIDRDYILPGAQGAIPNYDKLAEWIDPRFN